TIMGLVNDGDLFKCGIAAAGPTDFKLLYKGTWYASDDVSDEAKKYSMPQMIGDLEQDAAQLAATSPLEQAARIKRPLLLAYGGADRRVPTYHGKRLYDAASKTNQQVEWLEYPEEGHGWRLEKNRIDYWRRVEQFLDKHIGKPQ
ncbi:MAG TPA: prolyl oligopeptidase family serine peptidase, partial [Telluria sp.]|nr:prolyl oligopeptidase family serine peptidase [Telluria sp.]